MKRLLPIMLGTILAMAVSASRAQQQPAYPPATTAELLAFRDRIERLSMCAQLALKILQTRGGHGPDWDDPTLDTRYDPATGHCYVWMSMVSAPSFRQTGVFSATATVQTTLWDGQTQELLATTTMSRHRRSGAVFAHEGADKHGPPSADNGYGFDDADNYINRLMYENR